MCDLETIGTSSKLRSIRTQLVLYSDEDVDLIIRIKPFRLVLGSITDRDNQGFQR